MDASNDAFETNFLGQKGYNGYQWYLMAAVACTLLTLSFLFAGLTLGVCGLDVKWLEMRCLTGTDKQRKHALVVLQMKRNGSWLLCSLIICSVTCSEYFPFVIDGLCGVSGEWVSVIISTVLIAVFAEIIPQWLIPRHAVTWGYHCWPLIWTCMWLTSIISFPLAWILDSIGGDRKDVLGLFSNEQLAILIKHHEQSENKGGKLDPGFSRIMLGALNLNGREIGGDILSLPRKASEIRAIDVEKGDFFVNRGILVKWSAVKTVDMNDKVDHLFVKKVANWPFSRIPVVRRLNAETDRFRPGAALPWEGTQVFGLLYVKDLIGIDFSESSFMTLRVKNLKIYPLPIVTDQMPLHELLYLFQLGASRMALVIPTGSSLGSSQNEVLAKNAIAWAGPENSIARIASQTGKVVGPSKMTIHSITASENDVEKLSSREGLVGIRSPKPIGIITFEDIIDAILQRRSHDEKEFFDQDSECPSVKLINASDQGLSLLKTCDRTAFDILTGTSRRQDECTLRKRNVSKRSIRAGLDGADDDDVPRPDSKETVSTGGMNRDSIKMIKNRHKIGSSSYTNNSQGGFHDGDAVGNQPCLDSSSATVKIETQNPMTTVKTPEISDIQPLPYKSATLPSRQFRTFSNGNASSMTRRNFSASPRLAQSQPTYIRSRRRYSNDDRHHELFVMPLLAGDNTSVDYANVDTFDSVDHARDYFQIRSQEASGDTVTLSSWYGDRIFNSPEPEISIADQNSSNHQEDLSKNTSHNPNSYSLSSPKYNQGNEIQVELLEYDGFPPDLLDSNKESRTPNYLSKTVPRMTTIFVDTQKSWGMIDGREILSREHSFHDDRALLPSQRRLRDDTMFVNGKRNSSMWL